MIVWDQSLWRKKRAGIFIDDVLLFRNGTLREENANPNPNSIGVL